MMAHGTYLNSKGEDLFESPDTLEIPYLFWPIVDSLGESTCAEGRYPTESETQTANRIIRFAEKVMRA